MRYPLIIASLALALVTFGCDKDAKSASTPEKVAEAQTEHVHAEHGHDEPGSPAAEADHGHDHDKGAAHSALSNAYEALRKALVNDDLAGAKAAGKVLVTAAKAQAAIAAAAGKLNGAADIEAARLAFGATSKAYIGLLSSNPAMAKGMHAFTCPMAKGYKKWVQTSKKLENPYMGQRMLKCGGPTDLKP